MKKLFTLLTLICAFQLTYAQNSITVSGQFTNTNAAAINVWLSMNDAGTWLNATAVTDAAGYYSATFTPNSTQGIIYMYADDCNFDTLQGTVSFTPLDSAVVLPTLDYCPNTGGGGPGTGCYALFTVSQATMPNGTVVPGTLVVTDSVGGGTAPYTYTWDFGDGTSGTGTQLAHTYSTNGPYILCLTITDASGCTSTFCDSISVDSLGIYIEAEGFNLVIGEYSAPLSINDSETSAIHIFPNPAKDFINIEFDGSEKSLTQIRMFDLSGKIVFNESLTASSTNILNINTENFEPGAYIIQILDNNGFHNHKVILE